MKVHSLLLSAAYVDAEASSVLIPSDDKDFDKIITDDVSRVQFKNKHLTLS